MSTRTRGCAGTLTETRAHEIVLATEAAWNARNLRALMNLYTEDFTYWTNWGGADNGPRSINGRQEYICHLAALRDTSDIHIRLVSFRLEGNQGRAHFEAEWRDPQSGLCQVFTSRNVITFAGERIARLEVYRDAPTMQAFTSMIENREK